MKIIFLDIDGVLNWHDYDPDVGCGEIHPDKVVLLNGVLRDTGAKIVLSSAWRYLVHRGDMTLTGLEWLLRSHGILKDRLIGITDIDTMVAPAGTAECKTPYPLPNERGEQITMWLGAYPGTKPSHIAAIDDLDLGISAAGVPLVLTDGTRGMTFGDAQKLTALLMR